MKLFGRWVVAGLGLGAGLMIVFGIVTTAQDAARSQSVQTARVAATATVADREARIWATFDTLQTATTREGYSPQSSNSREYVKMLPTIEALTSQH